MHKIIFVLVLTLMVSGEVWPYSITTQTGYELNGFTQRNFKNEEYQLDKSNHAGILYKNTSLERDVRYSIDDNGIKYIYYSDRQLPNKNEVTSVAIENGKIKSQLNCVNPEKKPNQPTGCSLITKEICNAVLKASGKKDFADFLAHVKSCGELLNAHNKAVDSGKIQKEIKAAYKEHVQLLENQRVPLEVIKKLALPELFGNLPELKSSGSVEYVTDYRLVGLINVCANYLNRNSFADPIADINTGGGGLAAPGAPASK